MTRVRCVCRVCDRAEGGGGAQRGGCERIAGKGMCVRLTEQLLCAEQHEQDILDKRDTIVGKNIQQLVLDARTAKNQVDAS